VIAHGVPSAAHADVGDAVGGEREVLEDAVAALVLGALVADAEEEAAGVVVLVEAHHYPLLLVGGVVEGHGARVGEDAQIDPVLRHDVVVVVVRRALCAHAYYAVVAALVLLEAELLPEAVVCVDVEHGGVERARLGERGRHLGGEGEGLGVVDFLQQDWRGVVRDFLVGVAEEVHPLARLEAQPALADAHERVGSVDGAVEPHAAELHRAGLACLKVCGCQTVCFHCALVVLLARTAARGEGCGRHDGDNVVFHCVC